MKRNLYFVLIMVLMIGCDKEKMENITVSGSAGVLKNDSAVM